MYRMKLLIVWLCIISELHAFPTHPPPTVETRQPCCAGNPQLIYKGRDSKHGINVFVFEFPPVDEESKMKDKNVEYTTMKYNVEDEENSLTNIADGEQYEDTVTQTNTPANIYDNNILSEMFMNSTQDSIHMPDMNLDTINDKVPIAQNDTEMYGDSVLGSNVTEGSQAETKHNREVRRTSGHSDVDDFYSTEGSALIDIPGYNDSDAHDSNVYFRSVNDEFNNTLGCTELDGLCGNSSKYIDLVTQPTTHKENYNPNGSYIGLNGYGTGEENTVNSTVKWRVKPTNTVSTNKHKGDKNPDKSNVNKKDSPKKYSTGKIVKISRGHRRRIIKHGGSRRHRPCHRHSSSESSSDSSQQCD